MGHVQSALMCGTRKKKVCKPRLYRSLRFALRPKHPPAERQPLVEFLGNFPPAPEDWSDVQKVLVVENEATAEIAQSRDRQLKGLKWIVHMCILQSDDPEHSKAKWTFVKLDTQAQHSVMFASEANRLGLQVFANTTEQYNYYGINDRPVECIGWVNISFMVEGCEKTFHAHVDILKDSPMQGQVRQLPFSMLLGQEVINKYEWVQPSPDLRRALHHVYRTNEIHKRR